MKISVPYHHSVMEAEIDDAVLNGVYSPGSFAAEADGAALVDAALDAPIGSERLETLAAGAKTAVVIASDHTRPVPSRILMPRILSRLRAGRPDIRITILVATGCHRGTTAAELRAKFGDEIFRNETIVVHDCDDRAMLVDAGRLPSGGRFLVNRLVMDADLVVSEGFIEPHFFAGFSGGRKSILPGVASRETVLANHCAEFIDSPFARTGILENNPVHCDMLWAAERAKLAFIVNVVLGREKQIIRAFAGHFRAAHETGCRWLADHCRVRVPLSDIVITSNGGYPLDQNIYQSVKGMTAAEAVCRPGGVIIMVSACSEGHGGEAFFRALSAEPDARKLLESVRRVPREGTTPDQWQYQILLRILERFTVIVVTRDCDHRILDSMHLQSAYSIEEALAAARAVTGENARIAVIPDGVSVIAELQN